MKVRTMMITIIMIGLKINFLSALTENIANSTRFFELSMMKPQIKNEVYLFNLQEEPNEDALIEKYEFPEGSFSFVLYGLESFKEALSHFLTDRERQKSFLEYSVVDNSISGRLQISLIAGVDYHTDFKEQYLHLYRGVQVRGNIYNRLVLWGNWWAGRFQGDLDYAEANSPLIKGFYKSHHLHPPYTHLNKISGNITYLFNFGKVAIGRGTHLVGDNISGSIVLNDAVNDYGYFSTEIYFGKLSLSFLHATLIPDGLSDFGDFDYQDKYLVMHHLNYQPRPQLDFYFGEQIIYANRSIDPSYLLPHTFYRITEHNLQDRDNVLIYAGMQWTIRNLLTLYGSISLDELRKSEIFGDWWGNKYAIQGGISWLYGEGLIVKDNEPIRTTVEFTAIRPWMYTHQTALTTFSHDGFGLGFPEGSNLLQVAGEVSLPLIASLKLNQFLSYTKQGSVGNDFSINYNDRPSDTAKWLEGDKSERWLNRSVLSWNMLTHHKFRIGLELLKVDQNDWQQNLIFGYQAMY
ncbi:MAG: hypothetical protein K0B81_01775 [Candidatus Cloacimonetes bacterium]|nr:hypothetical protein [Candidatus Cloacimonadota bacterium]